MLNEFIRISIDYRPLNSFCKYLTHFKFKQFFYTVLQSKAKCITFLYIYILLKLFFISCYTLSFIIDKQGVSKESIQLYILYLCLIFLIFFVSLFFSSEFPLNWIGKHGKHFTLASFILQLFQIQKINTRNND